MNEEVNGFRKVDRQALDIADWKRNPDKLKLQFANVANALRTDAGQPAPKLGT